MTPLIRVLAVSMFISSLRAVPMTLAERRLNYRAVALADVSGQLGFYVIAVAGAYLFGGAGSLVAGALASGILGTAVVYLRVGWWPRPSLRLGALRGRLGFGLLFQGQNVSHFAKDVMIPALSGSFYGAAATGYLNWAQQVSLVPVQLVAIVARSSYPAMAAIHERRSELERLIRATLNLTHAAVLPVIAVAAAWAPTAVHVLYGDKWIPALPALYLLLAGVSMGALTGILMPALYSVGNARRALAISVIWTGATYGAALAAHALGWGFVGLAGATLAGTIVAVALILISIRVDLGLNALPAVVRPIAGAAAALIVGVVLERQLGPRSPLGLLIAAAELGVVWAVLLWPWREEIVTLLKRSERVPWDPLTEPSA
jgi:O-antigen/teichoic acid export membrane protein